MRHPLLRILAIRQILCPSGQGGQLGRDGIFGEIDRGYTGVGSGLWGSRPGFGNLLRVSRTPQQPTEHHSRLSSRFWRRLNSGSGGPTPPGRLRILKDRDLTTSWYKLGRCHHMNLHIFRFLLRPCPDFCWWGPLEVTHESN